jgi:hypothetical protein
VLPRPHNDLDRDEMIEMPRVARGGVTPFDRGAAVDANRLIENDSIQNCCLAAQLSFQARACKAADAAHWSDMISETRADNRTAAIRVGLKLAVGILVYSTTLTKSGIALSNSACSVNSVNNSGS